MMLQSYILHSMVVLANDFIVVVYNWCLVMGSFLIALVKCFI